MQQTTLRFSRYNFSRLDLRLDVAGRQVDVEIQKSQEIDFKQRAVLLELYLSP